MRLEIFMCKCFCEGLQIAKQDQRCKDPIWETSNNVEKSKTNCLEIQKNFNKSKKKFNKSKMKFSATVPAKAWKLQNRIKDATYLGNLE